MALSDHLGAAAEAGIVTAAQADDLARFIAAREAEAGGGDDGDAEAVRFARGFHDVFLTIGLVILMIGTGYTAALLNPWFGNLVVAVLTWALAEFYARRRRLVLPSIVLGIGWVFCAGWAIWAVAASILAQGMGFEVGDAFYLGSSVNDPRSVTGLVGALSSLLAAWLFWLRFRLPFVLATMAAAATIAVAVAISIVVPDASHHIYLPALLACGIAVFGAAMWFDLGDPQRLTMNSDNAFWLHLVAAPLIVHSMVNFISSSDAAELTTGDAALVLAVMWLLAMIALVIDRRALLVAGLVYLGFAIARFVDLAELDGSTAIAVTLLILGAAIVALGTGWRTARRAVVTSIVPAGLAARLPIVRASTP